MSTSTKWVIGILAGLIVLAVVCIFAATAFNWWMQPDWVMGERSVRPWFDRHMDPGEPLPMRPYSMMNRGVWFGAWLPLVGGALLCLVFPILIGLLVFALVRGSKRPAETSPATVSPAPQPVSAAEAPGQAPDLRCPNCDQPRQPDWKLCPYCGQDLSLPPE